MKVKLDIILDLPDDHFEDFNKQEILQSIFDEYTHRITQCHIESMSDYVFKFNSLVNPDKKDSDLNKFSIEHHNMWYKIAKEADVKISFEGEK
jgi:hypothetical protein